VEMQGLASSAGPRKGQPWSASEHVAFLRGLEKLGKGNWRGISRHFVPSRTPTQVASHAQKHFLRLGGNTKRRSRFSAIEQEVMAPAPAAPAPPPAKAPRLSGTNSPAAAITSIKQEPAMQSGAVVKLPEPAMQCMAPAIGVPVPTSSASSGSEGTAVHSTGSGGCAQGIPCFMPPPGFMMQYPSSAFMPPPFMFAPQAMASLLPIMAEAFAKAQAAAAAAPAPAQPAVNEVTSHPHADLHTLAEVASLIARPEAQLADGEESAAFKTLLSQLQLHQAPAPVPEPAPAVYMNPALLQPSAGSAFKPLVAA